MREKSKKSKGSKEQRDDASYSESVRGNWFYSAFYLGFL